MVAPTSFCFVVIVRFFPLGEGLYLLCFLLLLHWKLVRALRLSVRLSLGFWFWRFEVTGQWWWIVRLKLLEELPGFSTASSTHLLCRQNGVIMSRLV